jgi:GNAT superfamily N-acetyltransferase
MQIRIARHTTQLAALVAFYRDGVGLPELGGFRDHAGYDGVFLEIPGTGAHLELTAGGVHDAPTPHPESLLVFYLGDEAAVRSVAERLPGVPVAPANPYWAEHGLTFEDPDGFRVVLVAEPWAASSDRGAIRVEPHTGPRAALRPLFELAEDSAEALDAYINEGRVLVALAGDEVVGHLQITAGQSSGEAEVKNMAVEPAHQGRGVGRALMVAAAALVRHDGRSTLVVATATADIGNLRFYQRLGFRMRSVERDAFTRETGYAAAIDVDGIELRDRVWLDLPLAGPEARPPCA